MVARGFDLAVVAGGIIGLAHAYVAARVGLRVVLIERDVRADGASIRNFGFITVSGQARGDSWSLARRTRDVWAEVVQGADGGLIVGDSHHYARLPKPFAPAEAEREILDEFARAIGLAPPPVLERWTGVYPVAADRTYLIDTPEPGVRLVVVTSGTGASTGFALAERVLEDLLGVEAIAA